MRGGEGLRRSRRALRGRTERVGEVVYPGTWGEMVGPSNGPTAGSPAQRGSNVSELAKLSPARAAMLLALTTSREEEETLKQSLEANGHYKCAVTELGARLATFRERLLSAVTGAALNCGVVSKTPQHMHALSHAAHEALAGFLPESAVNGDVAAKIAVVRDSQWVAVALFGEWAEHPVCNHNRSGLGVMHIAY